MNTAKSFSPSQKPFILVDGSSYLYRAFHALPALMNSKGFPTGAVYGMINMLKRLMSDYQPNYMAVVFDAKGKTFRDEIYEDYKATRQEMPTDLVKQIPKIHELITALGIPIITIEGVEADDVIGTLAIQAANKEHPVLISTGDKDMAQFVQPHITLINTMTNFVMDREGVIKKFGVPPEKIVDYLSLVGDTSDNIKGIPLIGPKTAVKLLQTYGDLEGIMANADKVSGKVGENLRAHQAALPLAKQLVTIKLDVPLSMTFQDLSLKDPDLHQLGELYKAMEFKTWLKELLGQKMPQQDQSVKVHIVDETSTLQKLITQLRHEKRFSFSINTSEKSPLNSTLLGICFSTQPVEAYYVPIQKGMISNEVLIKELAPIFKDDTIQKISHDMKMVMEVFATLNLRIEGKIYDTLLEAYVLDSSQKSENLNDLTLKYLGRPTKTMSQASEKSLKKAAQDEPRLHTIAENHGFDTAAILSLHETLWPKIAADAALTHIYRDIEIPLLSVLARMELCGVLIDAKLLKSHGQSMQERLTTLEREVFDAAGSTFNLNSPKQLQEILFQKLKLPVLQKTPTGQPSTADGVLQTLALDFEIPRLVIEHRALSKLISTYTGRLIEQINPKSGRVHTTYHQSGTATGRLSSSDPNLQNIPIRSSHGRKIREAFIAAKGHKLLSADYSQIELRIMAHISQDQSLLNAFAHELDIHAATAAEVFGVPLEEVTQDMRRNAKAINFGLIYGMSAFGLTRQLGIDRKAAESYIERYFERYPGVKAYMEGSRQKAREKGYVETLWGRRLYIPDIQSSQIPRRKAAERVAINAPLQGSAADIIKKAMIAIDEWLQHSPLSVKMIMQVHDELVFEILEKDVDEACEMIKKLMQNAAQLDVPLLVAQGLGDHWDQASKH